jgi:H+/Cl- antiporter ClcA
MRPALLWFGLFGAPAAWVVQHVSGYALTEVSCTEGSVSLDPWTIAVTAVAAVIAALAGAAAVATWRATHDAGKAPPASRVHFLSVMGMVHTPLFLMIILMSGVGASLLDRCVQS